jgi:tetratricopeptide (TPR) repeat protein
MRKNLKMFKYKLFLSLSILFLFSLSLFAGSLIEEKILLEKINTAKNKKEQVVAKQNLIKFYIANSNYEESKSLCLTLLGSKSKLSKKQKFQIYIYLINTYKYLNNYNSAIEACKETEFLYPKNILPKIILADIYMDNILYENAKTKYKEALLIDKNSRQANVKIADIYAMQGAFDLAYKHYETAQKIQPDVSTSIKMAKSAIELGLVDKAMRMLEQVYNIQIHNDIAITLANLYKEHGRFKDAEKTLLLDLETNGNDLDVSLNLASLYILFQHYDKAKVILLSTKNKFPDIEAIDFLLAETYYYLSDKKTAIHIMKEIIATTKSEYIRKHSQNMLNTYK